MCLIICCVCISYSMPTNGVCGIHAVMCLRTRGHSLRMHPCRHGISVLCHGNPLDNLSAAWPPCSYLYEAASCLYEAASCLLAPVTSEFCSHIDKCQIGHVGHMLPVGTLYAGDLILLVDVQNASLAVPLTSMMYSICEHTFEITRSYSIFLMDITTKPAPCGSL